MVTMFVLAVSLTTINSPERHVRATEPQILQLIDAGCLHSETFRRLVTALDGSNVIVYIEPKLTRPALGGYLAHTIVTDGQYRYLRIAVETQGAQRRLVSLLAHELQHAIEVSLTPEARDAETLRKAFEHLALKFGCGATTCYETAAAKTVEHIVSNEFARRRSSPTP